MVYVIMTKPVICFNLTFDKHIFSIVLFLWESPYHKKPPPCTVPSLEKAFDGGELWSSPWAQGVCGASMLGDAYSPPSQYVHWCMNILGGVVGVLRETRERERERENRFQESTTGKSRPAYMHQDSKDQQRNGCDFETTRTCLTICSNVSKSQGEAGWLGSVYVTAYQNPGIFHKLCLFWNQNNIFFFYWSTSKTSFFEKYIIFHVDCWKSEQKSFGTIFFCRKLGGRVKKWKCSWFSILRPPSPSPTSDI